MRLYKGKKKVWSELEFRVLKVEEVEKVEKVEIKTIYYKTFQIITSKSYFTSSELRKQFP